MLCFKRSLGIARSAAIALAAWAISTGSGDPVVFQSGLAVKPFSGTAAGKPPIASPKFSVIDAPNGMHGGMMYVSQLGGADVVQVQPDGTVVPYTMPWGPFMSGAAGVTIDGATADLPAPTMGLYGGPALMFVAEVGALGAVNQINPGGAWFVYAPPPVGAPGSAGLVIDRTPGFAYGGSMYVCDWGGDGTDAILTVLPGGFVVPFAPLPGLDPRYMTMDSTGGATGYGPNAMWVSSYNTGAVFAVTPAGVAMPPLAVLAPGVEGLSFGLGDAVFGTDLYVANLVQGTIDRVRPDGSVIPFAAGFAGAAYLQFVNSGPYARGGNPTLYVDDGLDSIWVIEVVAEKRERPTFSIDYQGPPKGTPDARFQFPITEGDILLSTAAFGGPAPEIFISAGMGPPGPGLALPLHPASVGLPPGVPGHVELDALSYGRESRLGVGMPGIPERIYWYFSVDEWALGVPGTPKPPNVWTEGAAGNTEASADVFVDVPPIGPGPYPPGPTWGNTDRYDGDGVAPPGPPLTGLDLTEPNPPIPGLPDDGSTLDAFDVDTDMVETWPVYFSLDSSYTMDVFEGVPGTASAVMNGPFVGGDVLVSVAPGALPMIFAPAPTLGLDLFAPDTDDLDALILWENGNGVYDPPYGPYSWVDGSTDMLLFSVRRGSTTIGMLDSLWGAPIEPGDILLPPPGPFMTPGIWIPAEMLGLATQRSGTGAFGDDLDAADLAICLPCDANCDGSINGFDIEPFTALLDGTGMPCSPCAGDTNGDGSLNGFDIQGFIACLS